MIDKINSNLNFQAKLIIKPKNFVEISKNPQYNQNINYIAGMFERDTRNLRGTITVEPMIDKRNADKIKAAYIDQEYTDTIIFKDDNTMKALSGNKNINARIILNKFEFILNIFRAKYLLEMQVNPMKKRLELLKKSNMEHEKELNDIIKKGKQNVDIIEIGNSSNTKHSITDANKIVEEDISNYFDKYFKTDTEYKN